jgi:hypothetical protein
MVGLWLAPLVAVLPFRDVSGGGAGGVGEAVRAAAVAELQSAGVSTVPRDELERAFDLVGGELDHQELDASPSVAKLARLTNAQVVLAGGYDVRGDQVKLWARFYQGKKGRLLSTTTVSGQGAEFLQLVHGLDLELLRAAHVEATPPAKPLVRSLRAVELFGQAELAHRDEQRRDLLQRAIDEDPTFELAVRALEKMPPDPERVAEQLLSRFGELDRQRKWRTLAQECAQVVAHPPPPVADLSEQVADVAQVLLVSAYDHLHDDEAVVREGQKFLAAHAGGKSAGAVKVLVDLAVERRRARVTGVAQAAAALAKLSTDEKRDPCRLGLLYEDANQLKQAREAFSGCVALKRPGEYLAHLIWVEFRLGNFAAVPPLLEKLRVVAPALYPQVAKVADELPAD